MTRALVVALVAGGLGACEAEAPALDPVVGEPPIDGPCDHVGTDDRYATCVASFAPATDASFGHDQMPHIVLGPPMPPAGASGSTDVASLGCGGTITLGFRTPVVDGPGDDLVVFENAFATGDSVFAEPARVMLSRDGERWFAIPCLAAMDATQGCAGATPTEPAATHAEDASTWGGDGFDLAEVGLDEASWIRLVDQTVEFWGDDTWCGPTAGGFDLDAVAKVSP
jgi:hypothetical protein